LNFNQNAFWAPIATTQLERQSIQAWLLAISFRPKSWVTHWPPDKSTNHQPNSRCWPFRAGTALFWGHLGIEWNRWTPNEAQKATIANLVCLISKQHREHFCTGQ